MSKINIIGAGISGLSAACFAAKQGNEVSVFEKNGTVGGRARIFDEMGFRFDMGPSWYWMPDIFETFFNHFGKSAADYYKLVKLDPGFRIFFEGNEHIDIPADAHELDALFESIEPGSSRQLEKYLADAEFKYNHGMLRLAYKPSLSWLEFVDPRLIASAAGMKIFQSMSTHVRRYFKDKRLIALMEFPVLFLGAMPDNIPSLYSLMNYAALKQGTWYPMGGMHKIIEGMHSLATSLGVKFHTDAAVTQIDVDSDKARRIVTAKGSFDNDVLIATGDYHHIEQQLLEPAYRNYEQKYWDKKIFAPSCLIFYIGVNKELPNLLHHNLFFDADMERHSEDIYKDPAWPVNPLFYVCCPSKTDNTVAPEGCENLFILIPVAAGLEDDPNEHEYYYDLVMSRIEKQTGTTVKNAVVFRKNYSITDFETDYNAFKGNAYGLANTLLQTAVLKPKLRSKKVNNLFYAGQLTVPGPGVPPCLISGQLAANEALKHLKSKHHEAAI